MRIRFPHRTKPLDLGEYAPEYKDQPGSVMQVWINPPLEVRNRLVDLTIDGRQTLEKLAELSRNEKPDEDELRSLAERMEQINRDTQAFWAEIWSQHADESTHFTAEDVREFAKTSAELDPGLYPWAINRSWELITDFLSRTKKA